MSEMIPPILSQASNTNPITENKNSVPTDTPFKK